MSKTKKKDDLCRELHLCYSRRALANRIVVLAYCKMNQFKVLYYPNSECHPLVLAKSILVFDQITFFDHPSITFQSAGTVGHDSAMRQVMPILKQEGYDLNVLKLKGGIIEGDLEKMIDADLGNRKFRSTFLHLLQHDPSFLINKVPSGNYGQYGDAENLRKLILAVKNEEIPMTVQEMKRSKQTGKIEPPMLIALNMAADSYQFNVSTYFAVDQDIQLFGESKGMDMLLNAKFTEDEIKDQARHDISNKLAFTLLDQLIPNKAFQGKSIVDIVRFRNETMKEREKFKEHIVEITLNLQDENEKNATDKVQKILYTKLLPEARDYQYKLAESWDRFFNESTKAVLGDTGQITQIVVTSIGFHSFAAALLAGAARVGMRVVPHLIDYLKEKEAIERRNPYAYLMKFK